MNGSRSSRVIVASLLTVLGILFTQFPNSALANPTPTPTSSASALTCKKYVFIGMRGSGEKFTPNGTVDQQMGPEMASLYAKLETIEPFKGNIEFNGVSNYQAMGVAFSKEYIQQVRTVATAVLKEEIDYMVSCPLDTQFILAGYSQGAYAAHWVAAYIDKNRPDFANRILGVILLADPGKPGTGVFDFSRSIISEKRLTNITKTCDLIAGLSDQVIKLSLALKRLDIKQLSKIDSEKFSNLCVDLNEVILSATAAKELDNFDAFKTVVQPFYFDKPGDIVADSARALRAERDFSTNKAKTIFAFYNLYTGINKGIDIHSSYCSTKLYKKSQTKASRCNEATNQEFITEGVKYLKSRQ
jgi:hypothetical protein